MIFFNNLKDFNLLKLSISTTFFHPWKCYDFKSHWMAFLPCQFHVTFFQDYPYTRLVYWIPACSFNLIYLSSLCRKWRRYLAFEVSTAIIVSGLTNGLSLKLTKIESKIYSLELLLYKSKPFIEIYSIVVLRKNCCFFFF